MILDKIQECLEQFSPAQQQVAQYILANPEQAAYLTASRLAEASQVSEATVVRFAAALGYRRYAQMQDELRMLAQEAMSQMERLSRANTQNRHQTMMKQAFLSMRTDMKNIEKTMLALRETELALAVDWLVHARRVYVSGSHSEYGIACYFASTLSWIRESVFLLDQTHQPSFDSLAEAQEEDLLVAMSFPPYPANTVRFLEAAGRRGARTLAITDSPLSPLARRARCSLYAYDKKLSYADNSAPTVSLLSVLLLLVSNAAPNGYTAKLSEKQRYWEEIGFYYKEPLEKPAAPQDGEPAEPISTHDRKETGEHE